MSEELHQHGHEHPRAAEHRHPHHHDPAAGHEHAHTLSFERLTYILSPVHDLDPRAKVVACLVLVLGIVLAPAPHPAEAAAFALFVAGVTVAARLPLGAVFGRSLVVLPVAAGIALLAPFGGPGGWALAWAIVARSWMSAVCLVLLSLTTRVPLLFRALRALHLPGIMLTMLTFVYRFTDVLRDQLSAMRVAVASRAPQVRGRALVALYGNLAGSLFVRAYERGERVYAAMLSRGYDGTLPSAEALRAGPGDALALFTAAATAAAMALW